MPRPALRPANWLQRLVNFLENFLQPVAKVPLRVMLAELADVADPPDVVADSVVLDIFPREFSSANFFAKLDRFEHRAVTIATSTDVINLSHARRPNERGEGFDQVVAVNVITHLPALLTDDTTGAAALP